MTPSEERALYASDLAAWMEYAAPRLVRAMASETDAQVRDGWARMSREYQLVVWRCMPAEQRVRLTALRRVA